MTGAAPPITDPAAPGMVGPELVVLHRHCEARQRDYDDDRQDSQPQLVAGRDEAAERERLAARGGLRGFVGKRRISELTAATGLGLCLAVVVQSIRVRIDS